MKKNKSNFKLKFSSDFIAKFIVILSCVLSVIFVIPFYGIIGDKGGALFGYAYIIYSLFLGVAVSGIPLSVSRIVNEYQTLGYHNIKRRTFKLAKKIALLIGFIGFILLMICAPLLAKLILGNLVGGNTIKDIVLVIRIISIALLINPLLNVYKGYFDAHRLSKTVSFSRHLERMLSIILMLCGSFITLKIFKISLCSVVGVSLFGIILGLLGTYFYLVNFKLKNNKKFNEKIRNVNEPIITDKVIIKKILVYAIPFILIDIYKYLYYFIDVVSVVKGLVKYARFNVNDAETIVGMLTVWADKFNLIIVSVAAGIIIKFIPNLGQSIHKKDIKEICAKVNYGLSFVLVLILPLVILISFLAEPIWIFFYGTSKYGASVLAYYIFVGLLMGLLALAVAILQEMKDYKMIAISLGVGIVIKMLLNSSMIYTFHQYGMPAYYGVITASILAYLVSFIICLISLHIKYKIDYEETVKNFTDILCGSMLMVVVLFLMKFIVPITSEIRFINLFIVLGYFLVGVIVYLLFVGKVGVLKNIFGKKKISKEKK